MVVKKGGESMNNKNIFATNLKKYMKLNGKTRKDVCEALGFSYYTFSDWVNGKKYPRMDKVEMLANYFGILKSDLIEEKATEEMQKKNDTAVGIVKRLGTDKDFCELVKIIYKLDSKQIASVKDMLSSFIK